ncbi:MAG TPA: hypothetical protein VFV50_02125 [Bdellovibrionales bacterium]|nr:hypothetical protein [Bdellovibrionales bacterium]
MTTTQKVLLALAAAYAVVALVFGHPAAAYSQKQPKAPAKSAKEKKPAPKLPEGHIELDETSCKADKDCELTYYDKCHRGGCTPPCGINKSGLASVRKDRVKAYTERMTKVAQIACDGAKCLECKGELFVPKAADHKAACENGQCVLKGNL